MIYLDPDIFGCPRFTGYNLGKGPASTRHRLLKGRPRYRLNDLFAPYTVSFEIEMSDATFGTWQTFWAATGFGTDSFNMNLQLGSDIVYNNPRTGEKYTVHATGPWSAARSQHGYWVVSMTVEVAGGILIIGTLCDVILGSVASSDDIYGGPIDNLATDIIATCEKVLGHA